MAATPPLPQQKKLNLTRQASPVFRITKTKRDALNHLAEYFCLLVKDLTQLLYGEAATDIQRRSVQRTLDILVAEGLVSCLAFYDLTLDHPALSYVYGLTDKGVRLARKICDFPYPKTFDDRSARTLDHELDIAHFHMALKRFCVEHGLILFWKQKDLKCTVDPDALFAITDSAAPEDKSTMYYFLEYERAKLGNYKDGKPQLARKLLKYFDYYDTTGCEKEWRSFRRYRVIVVQRSDERRQNLLQALAPELKHRMFWLTTEPAYRAGIGERIFKTPKDHHDATYGLLP